VTVDRQVCKDAMARLAATVTIVTTREPDGTPRGFTASAVCPLSLDPPMVLVCVSRSGASHSVFAGTERFAVNVLRHGHRDLAVRFATSGVDRFTGAGFVADPHAPRLPDALAVFLCSTDTTYDGGDHTILLGRVDDVVTDVGEPLLYFERDFNRLGLVPAPGR
jgi:flavin reductase ActVB